MTTPKNFDQQTVTDLNNKFQRAVEKYNSREFSEATTLLQDIIRQVPHQVDSLNLLAIIYCQTGNFTQAIPMYLKAIEIKPNDASYHCNLGNAYQATKQSEHAINSYKKALNINPDLFQAYYNMGNVYRESNDFIKASESYEKCLDLKSDYVDALINLGAMYKERLIMEKPQDCFEKVLGLDPSNLAARNNLGIVLEKLKKHEKAVDCFLKSIEINPNSLEAYINLGGSYKSLEKYAEAIDAYNKALSINPNFIEGYNALGLLYANMGFMEKAEEQFAKALKINPSSAESHSNLGSIYQKQLQLDKAVTEYNHALNIDPNYLNGKINLATVYLMKGELTKGWAYWENRLELPWAKEQVAKFMSLLEKPKWEGQDLNGKAILVMSEQGYGDTIQFCRFLPELQKLGAKVYFRPQEGMDKLFEANPQLDFELLPSHILSGTLHYDYFIHMMSIPHILKTNLANIPATEGYLTANVEKIKEYKEKYFKNNKLKVGLCWQGATHHLNDSLRSIKLKNLYPLMDIDGIEFYSIQKGDKGEDQLKELPEKYSIIPLGQTFNDFGDTAAAIINLDLLITVDSSVAHLAGALNKPTWIITAKTSEWRWLMDREDSPWYKSVKLFRQTNFNDWNEVIEKIRNELIEKKK